MRPANFPTIRLAQLAAILQESHRMFDHIKGLTEVKDVERLFTVTANDYWHYHYVFDEPGPFKKKAIGKDMVRNLIINTVIPMLFAYGYDHNDETLKERAIAWMSRTDAEANKITNNFASLGIPIHPRLIRRP